jgi:regulator of sirC expression with transglutaminase-like and TPR domain
VNLLTTVNGDTMEAKKLRAKAIQTIGSIITSVSENEDKEPFKANVVEITQHLATTLQNRLSDDDP